MVVFLFLSFVVFVGGGVFCYCYCYQYCIIDVLSVFLTYYKYSITVVIFIINTTQLGIVICEVANGTAEDIELAVQAAKKCLYSKEWGYESTGKQRAVVLRRLGRQECD